MFLTIQHSPPSFLSQSPRFTGHPSVPRRVTPAGEGEGDSSPSMASWPQNWVRGGHIKTREAALSRTNPAPGAASSHPESMRETMRGAETTSSDTWTLGTPRGQAYCRWRFGFVSPHIPMLLEPVSLGFLTLSMTQWEGNRHRKWIWLEPITFKVTEKWSLWWWIQIVANMVWDLLVNTVLQS